MQTKCCRKCIKRFCINRDTIEDCPNCISEVYYELMKINKIIEEEERRNAGLYTDKTNG